MSRSNKVLNRKKKALKHRAYLLKLQDKYGKVVINKVRPNPGEKYITEYINK